MINDLPYETGLVNSGSAGAQRQKSMREIKQIAQQEALFYLKQISALFVIIIYPLVYLAAGALPQLSNFLDQTNLDEVDTIFIDASDTLSTEIGYVDRSGLFDTLAASSNQLQLFPDDTSARVALQAQRIDSFYVIEEDFIKNGHVTNYRADASPFSETDTAFSALLRQHLLNTYAREDVGRRLQEPFVPIVNGPDFARYFIIPPELDLQILFLALVTLYIFSGFLNFGSTLALRSLKREQKNGVTEMILSYASPTQIMTGKILGLSVFILIELSVSLGLGSLIFGRLNPDFGPAAIPTSFVVLNLGFMTLGYLAHVSYTLSIAIMWPNTGENATWQMLLRPNTLHALIGATIILVDADGILVQLVSWFPLTSPILMPFRTLVSPVPWWEIAGSWGLLMVWSLGSLWVCTRLYRANPLLRPTGLQFHSKATSKR